MFDKLKQIIGATCLVIGFGFLPSLSLAADIAENSTLPVRQNCAKAAYISDQWNKNTKTSNQNNALAYKKLICQSGREAFILIEAAAQNFSYRLIDHSNKKISEKDSQMCVIVNKYCDK